MDKLKPCPFCGYEYVDIDGNGSGDFWWGVCGNCGTEGPVRKSLKEATEAWNRRTEEGRNVSKFEEELIRECQDDGLSDSEINEWMQEI